MEAAKGFKSFDKKSFGQLLLLNQNDFAPITTKGKRELQIMTQSISNCSFGPATYLGWP